MGINGRGRSSVPSADQLGTSPSAPVAQSVSMVRRVWDPAAYGNARERARKHVRGEREVWRQRFIAREYISRVHPVS
jgi:hypothetical protein